jgi:hypothetical protein
LISVHEMRFNNNRERELESLARIQNLKARISRADRRARANSLQRSLYLSMIQTEENYLASLKMPITQNDISVI